MGKKQSKTNNPDTKDNKDNKDNNTKAKLTKDVNNNDIDDHSHSAINRNQFKFEYVIGKGGFGKVWKVFMGKSKKVYALKEMSKAKIIDKKCQDSIIFEQKLLAKIRHPFIVNMEYAFQDQDNLYLVLDYLSGGDLRYHISRFKKFTENQTKFFVACLLLALEYIHNNNIIHRDLKPENLVLDNKGYLRLTDFGIANIYLKENYFENSGTPGYMAPEVMATQNHTIAIDYFAVGVIAYEFMNGVRPYVGKNRKEIKDKMFGKQVQMKNNEVPKGWSVESVDFINKLLQRNPANRLGLRGPMEVKCHPWIANFPWKDLYNKEIEAYFLLADTENFDSRHCNKVENIGLKTQERYQKIINDKKDKILFKDYFFTIDEKRLYFQKYEEVHLKNETNMNMNINRNNKIKFNKNSNNASLALNKQYKLTENIDFSSNIVSDYNLDNINLTYETQNTHIVFDFQNNNVVEIDEYEEINY